MIQSFLDNDSFFGRFMTKLGIIIAANIMFVLLSIPFFTIGAGLSASEDIIEKRRESGVQCRSKTHDFDCKKAAFP